MREGNRANTLLVELLLVILFFMLACTTIVEIFGQARLRGNQATFHNEVILHAENLAEEVYGAEDGIAVLKTNGFTESGDLWSMPFGKGYLQVRVATEDTDAGTMNTYLISACENETVLFTLPVSRYLPKEVAP